MPQSKTFGATCIGLARLSYQSDDEIGLPLLGKPDVAMLGTTRSPWTLLLTRVQSVSCRSGRQSKQYYCGMLMRRTERRTAELRCRKLKRGDSCRRWCSSTTPLHLAAIGPMPHICVPLMVKVHCMVYNYNTDVLRQSFRCRVEGVLEEITPLHTLIIGVRVPRGYGHAVEAASELLGYKLCDADRLRPWRMDWSQPNGQMPTLQSPQNRAGRFWWKYSTG